MFHEDREIVSTLKQENKHFHNLFEKHNALDDKIANEAAHLSDAELETLKKQKLKLKDEMHTMINEYKKSAH
ncbi:MAG: hypothetical protein KU28_01230 [Sulfurovum sp. PC08-66]|nr:MAG: hypothetical protein KU28_01230 [Sulfurovum sp. PC08-66]KIM12579.1 MAG: hypothetical protein KU37_01345 [Sulfuricurvum sp. PC08-66]